MPSTCTQFPTFSATLPSTKATRNATPQLSSAWESVIATSTKGMFCSLKMFSTYSTSSRTTTSSSFSSQNSCASHFEPSFPLAGRSRASSTVASSSGSCRRSALVLRSPTALTGKMSLRRSWPVPKLSSSCEPIVSTCTTSPFSPQ